MMRAIGFTVVVSLAVLLAGPVEPGMARTAPRGAPPAPRFVREAQQALRDLGYRPGPIDGVVGPRTREALARYQRSQKIAVTGRLDSETMVRLDIQERVLRSVRAARG
jgi:hypothetical protein